MHIDYAALRHLWRFSGVSAALLAVSVLLGSSAHGGPLGPALGPWHPVSWRELPAAAADEGVAWVSPPGGRAHLVTRGEADVSPALSARGWSHVGDPGSYRGYVLDAYQGRPSMHAKLFLLTTPTGHRKEWIHRDAAGEMSNSSFAAIAPSGRWFVGGEWGRVTRLLVYPTPGLNPAARDDRRNLPLAGTIKLTRPVRDVQGCSFASSRVMFCATNDPRTDLFPMPRQLLRITLAHPLDGHDDRGTPHALGTLPVRSRCPGAGEVEGVAVSRTRLRVIVNEPNLCHGRSVLLTYARQSIAPRPARRRPGITIAAAPTGDRTRAQ